jgi:hypothetical protein
MAVYIPKLFPNNIFNKTVFILMMELVKAKACIKMFIEKASQFSGSELIL